MRERKRAKRLQCKFFAYFRLGFYVPVFVFRLMYNWWCISYFISRSLFLSLSLSVFFLSLGRPFLTFLLTKLRMKNSFKMNPAAHKHVVLSHFFFFPFRLWFSFWQTFKANSFTYSGSTIRWRIFTFFVSISYLNRMYDCGMTDCFCIQYFVWVFSLNQQMFRTLFKQISKVLLI